MYPPRRSTMASMRHQPQAVARSLGAAEKFSHLGQFFPGSEVGHGNIELGVLHVHIDADTPLLRGQKHAGLNGVIKEIAQDAAQVQLGEAEPQGDVRVRRDRNALGPGQGNLGVQDGVGHGVACFEHRVHGVQIRVQASR